MPQDIGFDLGTGGPSVTLLGSNLNTATLSALTSAADFGAPTPLETGFELKLDCQASAAGFAYLKAYWSHENTDFSSSDPDNGEVVAVVQCKASTVVTLVSTFPMRARYAKFALDNQSGGTINSAGTALALTDLFGDQA